MKVLPSHLSEKIKINHNWASPLRKTKKRIQTEPESP